jgi:hypothetical protein
VNRRLRHKRTPRPHPAELDPTSPAPPLPAGTVMLICRVTDAVLSEVLEAQNADGWWWPNGRWYQTGDRYAFTLDSPRCDHEHEIPTQDEIAAKIAEAKDAGTTIILRVNVKQ